MSYSALFSRYLIFAGCSVDFFPRFDLWNPVQRMKKKCKWGFIYYRSTAYVILTTFFTKVLMYFMLFICCHCPDKKAELKKLNRSILICFLELLDTLIANPSSAVSSCMY